LATRLMRVGIVNTLDTEASGSGGCDVVSVGEAELAH